MQCTNMKNVNKNQISYMAGNSNLRYNGHKITFTEVSKKYQLPTEKEGELKSVPGLYIKEAIKLRIG